MKILIVEDDRALNDGIALSLNGDEILQAYCIREARVLLREAVDLILLDISLPDGSGLALCRELRASSAVPVIFLTANDTELDIVVGLSGGGDDYITKPFSLAVLRARIEAVARRRQRGANTFRLGNWLFDFDSMYFSADGVPVSLSKTEQRLLRMLVENMGRTLSRERLLDGVWFDSAEFVEENALSVTVNRLRWKLPGLPVKTVYGIGYVWEK